MAEYVIRTTSKEGVLLLNAVLTVRAHEAASAGHGWETFTDAVVRAIAQRKRHRLHAVGKLRPAQRRHRRSPAQLHPQSRPSLPAVGLPGIFRQQTFSRANEYLQSIGKAPILW